MAVEEMEEVVATAEVVSSSRLHVILLLSCPRVSVDWPSRLRFPVAKASIRSPRLLPLLLRLDGWAMCFPPSFFFVS